jgi:hypothetical protein
MRGDRVATDDEVQAVRRIQDQMGADLAAVCERYEQFDGSEGPVFLAYVVIATLTETLGNKLKARIDTGDPRATPWVEDVLARLQLYVQTAGMRPQ